MTKAMPTERCNLCCFWSEDMSVRDPNDADFGFGHCRRAPPVLIAAIAVMQMPPPAYGQQVEAELDITSAYTASRFPATFATDWCGQFKEAKW